LAPFDLIKPNNFVLVVSPKLFWELSCEGQQVSMRQITELEWVEMCRKRGLPVDDMVYRLTAVEVDKTLEGLK
jgi:hypothetical protein